MLASPSKGLPPALAGSMQLSTGSCSDGDDWHEMLGIAPGDELTLLDAQTHLSNPHYGDGGAADLDVMGSLFAEAMTGLETATDSDQKFVLSGTGPSSTPGGEKTAPEVAPVPAPRGASARHRPVPNSVTVGRERRGSAGRAPKRLGEADDWGVAAASNWKTEEKLLEEADADSTTDAAVTSAPAARGGGGRGRGGRGAQDPSAAGRKRARACMPPVPDACVTAGDDANVYADAGSDCDFDAFAQALGHDEWAGDGDAIEVTSPPKAEAKRSRAGRKRVVSRKARDAAAAAEEEATEDAGAAGEGGAPGARVFGVPPRDVGGLPLVKRGSSNSLASTASAATTSTSPKQAFDMAGKLYDAMTGRAAAAAAAARAAAAASEAPSVAGSEVGGDVGMVSSESTAKTESIAGSDVGGKSGDELESLSNTRPASRAGATPPASATAPPAAGAPQAVVGLAQAGAAALAAPTRGSKFERKDWTAEEDEVRALPRARARYYCPHATRIYGHAIACETACMQLDLHASQRTARGFAARLSPLGFCRSAFALCEHHLLHPHSPTTTAPARADHPCLRRDLRHALAQDCRAAAGPLRRRGAQPVEPCQRGAYAACRAARRRKGSPRRRVIPQRRCHGWRRRARRRCRWRGR